MKNRTVFIVSIFVALILLAASIYVSREYSKQQAIEELELPAIHMLTYEQISERGKIRRLCLTLGEFIADLPELERRGAIADLKELQKKVIEQWVESLNENDEIQRSNHLKYKE